jgi:hypothetical protein
MENKSNRWVPWIALVISICAIGLNVSQAWLTSLSPAKVVGDVSYVVVWRFSSNNDGKVTEVALTPAFWLQNVGAQSVVIRDVRMIFSPKGHAEIKSFPISTVPMDAIQDSADFKDYGRISTGSPFTSFSLVKSQVWVSAYRFGIDALPELVGEVPVTVQVSTSDNADWTTVFSDSLDFGSKPFHLQPMFGGVQEIPVYTHRWSRRTANVTE